MFDRGDLAIGNVRIDRQLRRRRNDSGSGGACHRGNNGSHGDAGNINIVANVSPVGSVDNISGHLGNVRNVRLRLKQRCCIFNSNINSAHRAGRLRSHRNSVGICRNW